MITTYRNISYETLKEHMSRVLGEGIRSLKVRELAERAVFLKQDQIDAVFLFVRTHFRYKPDPDYIEYIVHPNRFAEDYFDGKLREDDCEGLALITASMLGSLGFDVRLAIVDADLDGEFDHAFCQVFRNNDWMWIDTASKKPMNHRYQVGEMELVIPLGAEG